MQFQINAHTHPSTTTKEVETPTSSNPPPISTKYQYKTHKKQPLQQQQCNSKKAPPPPLPQQHLTYSSPQTISRSISSLPRNLLKHRPSRRCRRRSSPTKHPHHRIPTKRPLCSTLRKPKKRLHSDHRT